MFGSHKTIHNMIVFGALLGVLSLIPISSSRGEEPSALDEAKEDKGDKTEKEKPKEKKSITVPAGT